MPTDRDRAPLAGVLARGLIGILNGLLFLSVWTFAQGRFLEVCQQVAREYQQGTSARVFWGPSAWLHSASASWTPLSLPADGLDTWTGPIHTFGWFSLFVPAAQDLPRWSLILFLCLTAFGCAGILGTKHQVVRYKGQSFAVGSLWLRADRHVRLWATCIGVGVGLPAGILLWFFCWALWTERTPIAGDAVTLVLPSLPAIVMSSALFAVVLHAVSKAILLAVCAIERKLGSAALSQCCSRCEYPVYGSRDSKCPECGETHCTAPRVLRLRDAARLSGTSLLRFGFITLVFTVATIANGLRAPWARSAPIDAGLKWLGSFSGLWSDSTTAMIKHDGTPLRIVWNDKTLLVHCTTESDTPNYRLLRLHWTWQSAGADTANILSGESLLFVPNSSASPTQDLAARLGPYQIPSPGALPRITLQALPLSIAPPVVLIHIDSEMPRTARSVSDEAIP